MSKLELESPTGLTLSDVVLITFLVLSLCSNVFLGWRLKALTGRAPIREAAINMPFPEVQATDSNGKIASLYLDQFHNNVIYIFKPNCVWCGSNWKALQALYDQGNTTVNFIGISTTGSGLNTYLRQYPFPFPVYVVDDKVFFSQIDFKGTPQTLLVTPQKQVVHNWIGAYDATTANAIVKAVGLTAPLGYIVPRN